MKDDHPKMVISSDKKANGTKIAGFDLPSCSNSGGRNFEDDMIKQSLPTDNGCVNSSVTPQ